MPRARNSPTLKFATWRFTSFSISPLGPTAPVSIDPPCPGSTMTSVWWIGSPSVSMASLPHGVMTRKPVGVESRTATGIPEGEIKPRGALSSVVVVVGGIDVVEAPTVEDVDDVAAVDVDETVGGSPLRLVPGSACSSAQAVATIASMTMMAVELFMGFVTLARPQTRFALL